MLEDKTVDLLNIIRQRGDEDFKKATSNGENWPFDHPIPGDYEETFSAHLNEGETFDNLLSKRKEQGSGTNVLDLFGSAFFIQDPSLASSITGVRLVDNDDKVKNLPARHTMPKKFQPRGKPYKDLIESLEKHDDREIIDGGFFAKESWRRLRERARKIGGTFDLITCRPLGGWQGAFPRESHYTDKDNPRQELEKDFPHFGKIFAVYLNRLWQLLSVGGEMFIELPDDFNKEGLEEFFSHVSESESIEVDYKKMTAHITKMENSSKILVR